MNKKLDSVREYLANTGNTEVGAIVDQSMAEEIWQEIQNTKIKMNKAKKEAADQAAIPYLEEIKKLEDQYALMLKLMN